MIERDYSIDDKYIKQTLSTLIQSNRKTVFHLLATTDGIASWFPQLSLNKQEDEQYVQFDMGDGTFEKMQLLDYKTDEHISYEWAQGRVEFQLKELDGNTELILIETLPITFNAIPEDFTGWYVQVANVKSVAETGAPSKLDRDEINTIKEDIRKVIAR